MIYEINGQHLKSLIDYGIRNLSLHRDYVNELNVFPVPDGDTGSNILLTLQNGFSAIKSEHHDIGKTAERFKNAVVFGARGNSGVIISQFFKGICDTLSENSHADSKILAEALKKGVDTAYASVSKPVEGTMLTVMREASENVKHQIESSDVTSVTELITAFCAHAKESLDRTPMLLPILKEAGVVDSGGAGLLFVFEGMKKYLHGEIIEEPADNEDAVSVDYSAFNKYSSFELGYCTELLIQLTNGRPEPEPEVFDKTLSQFGDSVVTVWEKDKLKLHIHTKEPGAVLGYCQRFGEFLSVKIENMSVQHSENKRSIARTGEKIKSDAPFSVIAVAHDPTMEECFLEMGADVTLMAGLNYTPSSADFLEAIRKCGTDSVLVFPNSKNSDLSVKQAMQLCENVSVTIIATASDAECYAALPMIDFGCDDTEAVVKVINETLSNVDTVLVANASRQLSYCGFDIEKDDIVAMNNDTLLAVGKELPETVYSALAKMFEKRDADVITVFAGVGISEKDKSLVLSHLSETYPLTEAAVIETAGAAYKLVLSFE